MSLNLFMSAIPNDHEQTVWKVKARSGVLVEAIKSFREFHGCSLKEAKDVVEAYININNEGPDGVQAHTIRLPNGGCLNVITNKHYASINYSENVMINVPIENVMQAVADATLRISARLGDSLVSDKD